jgi:hypothetical protein
MTVHELKIQPQYLRAIQRHEKLFEVRLNDRGYQKGDYLHLCEISEKNGLRTGQSEYVKVLYVHSGLGMAENYVCMSIEVIKDAE